MVDIWRRARAWVASRATAPEVAREHGGRLPVRLPWYAWALAAGSFLAAYSWTFTVVHVHADTTACLARLDDPLHHLIPFDDAWGLITRTTYMFLTGACVLAMLLQAILGDHRPLARFGMGLGVMGLLRGLCILLVPLCRATSPPGSIRLHEVPMLDLGFVAIPWRLWATNDMLFSGHVGEFLLILRLTRTWPPAARAILWLFSILQIYGLLATRGHYTVDILLAIPCAYFADRMAVHILSLVSPPVRSLP